MIYLLLKEIDEEEIWRCILVMMNLYMNLNTDDDEGKWTRYCYHFLFIEYEEDVDGRCWWWWWRGMMKVMITKHIQSWLLGNWYWWIWLIHFQKEMYWIAEDVGNVFKWKIILDFFNDSFYWNWTGLCRIQKMNFSNDFEISICNKSLIVINLIMIVIP